MTDRRTFVRGAGLAILGISLGSSAQRMARCRASAFSRRSQPQGAGVLAGMAIWATSTARLSSSIAAPPKAISHACRPLRRRS